MVTVRAHSPALSAGAVHENDDPRYVLVTPPVVTVQITVAESDIVYVVVVEPHVTVLVSVSQACAQNTVDDPGVIYPVCDTG